MVKSIQEASEKQLSPLPSETINFEIHSHLQPEFTSALFILENFSDIQEEIIYSEPLKINGVVWRLKVYPNGNGAAKDLFMSVFLEMTHGI